METASRKRYPSDLSDAEWAILEPLVPAAKHSGRPARWSRREILNGIFYALRAGGPLPHDLPPWQTVYGYYRRWRWIVVTDSGKRLALGDLYRQGNDHFRTAPTSGQAGAPETDEQANGAEALRLARL